MSKKKDVTQVRCTLFCCVGSACSKHGARETQKALYAAVREAGLSEETCFLKTHCTDHCSRGPIIIVADENGLLWYQKVKPKHAPKLVAKHLLKRQVLTKKLLKH